MRILSPELNQNIESAYIEMTLHPERALSPVSRKKIYDQLNLESPLSDRQAFKNLAITTANYVLTVMKSMQPDNNLQEHLIQVAEGRITNAISENEANEEAEKAWHQIENLGRINRDIPFNRRSFYANVTAHEALMEVLGRDPFKNVIIDLHTTDSDLDPWSSDTSHWAVAACAGQIGESDFDIDECQTFWKWWLLEAIPIAMNNRNDSYT